MKKSLTISSNYDHNPNHYFFQRTHNGDAPDRIKPLRPLWHEAVGLVLVLVLWWVVS